MSLLKYCIKNEDDFLCPVGKSTRQLYCGEINDDKNEQAHAREERGDIQPHSNSWVSSCAFVITSIICTIHLEIITIIVDIEVRKRRLHNFARQGTIQKEEGRDSKDSFQTEIVLKDFAKKLDVWNIITSQERVVIDKPSKKRKKEKMQRRKT